MIRHRLLAIVCALKGHKLGYAVCETEAATIYTCSRCHRLCAILSARWLLAKEGLDLCVASEDMTMGLGKDIMHDVEVKIEKEFLFGAQLP